MSTPDIISGDPQSQELVGAFAALLRGRTNGYGLIHGECIHEPVTLDHYRRRLKGAARNRATSIVERSRWSLPCHQ